jgi:hypothetical protein
MIGSDLRLSFENAAARYTSVSGSHEVVRGEETCGGWIAEDKDK